MMDNIHSLLKRQLKKNYGTRIVPEDMKPFIDMVNKAYFDFDTDRNMIERSMEHSSQELLQANADMREAQNQLIQSEKMASIGQLAAGVAHEINNPIGFISNNVEMLQRYVADYGKVLQMVEGLKKSIEQGDIEKAKSLVQEIDQFEQEIDLDYVINDIDKLLKNTLKGIERVQNIVVDLRIFAREGTDVMESVRIEDVIESILSIVHSELQNKADLKKNYGDTPLIRCNPQRMGQVFINLFVNASQAIEDKGTIEVKTYQEGKYLCIDVSDTGKGIPPENLNKVFDAFFTTKSVGKGTGLGLSVSYEIVKKHGGDIRVQSKVGVGTTFTVMLPLT
jgi:two-component system, NtrC family, sensor kinase